MKRIIPLILALALCGCAGKEAPEASEQSTVPQTQPVGLHIADHEIETASSGSVRAYDIAGVGVYAVEDGVGILDAEGKLTLIDKDEGLIQNTISHISQVIAAQGQYVYYYDGAVMRLDLTKEKTDTFTLPENMQGDFALCAQSQKIFYCVPGQVRALDMATGLDRLLKEHSAQEQTILGAYYDGAVIGWKTENGTAYLSGTDGSELSMGQGIESLHTYGQKYLLTRTDGMVEQVIAGVRGGESQLVNTNKLIRFYEGATGLKTGSTDNALYCLSGTAERDGMELIAVIMKDVTSAQRFEDAKALLSYGFSSFALKKVVPETPLAPIPVTLGTQSTVQPVLGDGSTLLLEKSKTDLQQSVSLAESVEAPVAKGSQLGTLTVSSEGEILAEIPILAGEEVPRITYSQMLLKLLRLAFLAG